MRLLLEDLGTAVLSSRTSCLGVILWPAALVLGLLTHESNPFMWWLLIFAGITLAIGIVLKVQVIRRRRTLSPGARNGTPR
jgi:hypothetical protein